MIVRQHGARQLLITQPDHAALAARIMCEWEEPALACSPRRDAILLATAEHDNGWRETDAAPIVDPASGRVLDFVALPASMRQEIWPRGVARLASVPYAAALVAQHALHVYSRFRDDPEWTPFFAEMTSARDAHLQAAAPACLDDLLADYQFVRAGDLVSLAFCNAWEEPQPDGFGRTVTFDGAGVTIDPDPFNGRRIDVEIAGRDAAAFHAGAAIAVRGTVSGPR